MPSAIPEFQLDLLADASAPESVGIIATAPDDRGAVSSSAISIGGFLALRAEWTRALSNDVVGGEARQRSSGLPGGV